MKYSIYYLIIFTLLFGGCSKEWIEDVEPQGRILEVNFYQNEAELNSAMIAVYNALKNQYWQGGWSGFHPYASFPSDDAAVHGGGRTDRPEFWDIYDYNVTPLTAGVIQLWSRSYYGIFRANVVIGRADPATQTGKEAIAEAKMLRALFNFDLVRYFGEVPLVDHVLLPSEYLQPKVDKKVIFDLIVSDLQAAAIDLPVSRSGADRYRATKYAALGYLGKVYVYMASPGYNYGSEYYDEAATVLKQVIDESPYELEEDFSQIWWYGNEFNKETLFEYCYSLTDASDRWGNGSDGTGNVIQQLCGPRGITGGDGTILAGWGFDMVSTDLVNQYKIQGDTNRLQATTMAEWQLVEKGYIINERNEDYSGYYCNKRMTWAALNPRGAAWGWGNNERVLRLGDIYLLYAEALASKTSPDEATAKVYVNLLRNRASGALTTENDLDDYDLGTIDDVMADQGLSLLEAIKLERRLELAMEFNRFFDLVRWDELKDNEILKLRRNFDPAKTHFPIPQSEIDASEGTLTQNDPY